MAMDPATFAALALGALGIGFSAGVTGIGGGTLMVPFMTLALGMDVKTAVASSLLATIFTSSSAAAVYLGEGRANLRVALTLEPSSALGAVTGAAITISLPESAVELALGIGLIAVASTMLARAALEGGRGSGRDGGAGERGPGRVALGVALSYLAGVASGMFGIGGGVVKVPVMNLAMGLPIKEAVATSSYMVGLTAATGGMIYLRSGLASPEVVAALALGIIPGATLGARILGRMEARWVRLAFALVLAYAGLRMFARGAGI